MERSAEQTIDVRLVDRADVPSDMSELQRSMLRDAVARPAAAVFR
jgi:hypothetical protein